MRWRHISYLKHTIAAGEIRPGACGIGDDKICGERPDIPRESLGERRLLNA